MRFILKRFTDFNEQDRLSAGNWYGNDSAWRMVADLARIFYFGDSNGNLHKSKLQRKLFCVVDGIVGGEKDGPLHPDPKRSGYVVGGDNPLAVDIVTTRLMGIDYRRLKKFKILRDYFGYNFGLGNVKEINIKNPDFAEIFDSKERFLAFEPHPGWKNFI